MDRCVWIMQVLKNVFRYSLINLTKLSKFGFHSTCVLQLVKNYELQKEQHHEEERKFHKVAQNNFLVCFSHSVQHQLSAYPFGTKYTTLWLVVLHNLWDQLLQFFFLYPIIKATTWPKAFWNGHHEKNCFFLLDFFFEKYNRAM